jgi:hypothetical protein
VQVFSEDFFQTPSVPQGVVKGWSKTCNGFGGNVRKVEEREKGKEMKDLEECDGVMQRDGEKQKMEKKTTLTG